MPYKYKKISVNGRKIDEHRYVVEQALGRYLKRSEVVKHKNGNVRDNRIENLYLVHVSVARAMQFIEGNLNVPNDEKRKIGGMTTRNKFGKQIIICDINGNELMSVISVGVAALVVGCSKGNVSDVICGRKKQTHGFKFKNLNQ